MSPTIAPRKSEAFADSIFAYMRETISHAWKTSSNKESDHFRVIIHEKFDTLEWVIRIKSQKSRFCLDRQRRTVHGYRVLAMRARPNLVALSENQII